MRLWQILIIAYRELRSLEIEVLRAMASRTDATQLELEVQSVVDVDQFYGIEISEFPDPHRRDRTLDDGPHHEQPADLGVRQDLREDSDREVAAHPPRRRAGDRLSEVLSPNECSYVFGNPPFGGAKFQSAGQRVQVRRIAALGGSGRHARLCGRVVHSRRRVRTAHAAVEQQSATRIGFVATNSITQGEQIAQLWPLLLDRHRLEIAFAHRTFAWGSDARGKAHVHVVIIGLDTTELAPPDRRLFTCEDSQRGAARKPTGP